MKKNLRIVSVAAAALLAVAPVAASAVSIVNADAITSVTQLGGITVNNGDTVNVKPNISLNTSVPDAKVDAAISVSFSATVNGTTAVSNFEPGTDGSTVELKNGNKEIKDNETLNKEVTQAEAGKKFTVVLTKVGLNFGTKNANKDVTLSFPEGASASTDDKGALKDNLKVHIDNNGVVNLPKVQFTVTAKDFSNPTVVTWFNKTTKAPVTAGNITLYAGSDAGKMNVAQVVSEAENEYKAFGAHLVVNTTNNIKEALKAMNVDVDANGWFTAPKSFTFNMTATSDVNNATATLPITVTVPNGKEVTPATVPSQSKTIMHNAYYYDKNAKRVGTDKVTRYDTVTVATSTTTINGISYYEVVENGKATGKYINADNIDGTKRTLKHNAYVYKSSKKRAKKVVLKKGTEVTTYGSSYKFKNGKKYYKIGADTKKTYVRVENFD
ncbi:SLAP domain-containing protein [Lactobacillus helveticus]|uniref:SLAP domain-containing protein n=1 Tax=Lactobacillus helveticus TaxID=1587 RepID=UPI001562282C|nr:SLAP domain-containing protein [Lactobacillus helveticus]NRO05420.1 S-layer protein [Lactobacillus helveticus]